MNMFIKNIATQEARTANGMKALKGTGSALVDLFNSIGSSRKTDITPKFIAAYHEDKELAARIALWARDARGGAGERESFRKILRYLFDKDQELLNRILDRTPELGRWDDLLTVPSDHSYELIRKALSKGLMAKEIMEKIDHLSEQQCKQILDDLS